MSSTTIMAPDWSARIAGAGADEGNSVCMDNSGNSYVLGRFSGSTTTNPLSIYNRDKTKTLPDLSASTTSSPSIIFLVKYDPSGSALWRLRIGTVSASTFPYSMTIDNSNNLIIAATFAANSPATIYNTSDVSMVTLTTNSQTTGFIAKINPNGQSVFWTKRFFSTTLSTTNPHSVKVDSQNNVYITGRYNVSMSIDGATGTANPLLIISGTDTFIIKYDSAGNYKWATAIGNTGTDTGYKVAVDKNDNILITGAYNDTLNIYDVSQVTFTRSTTVARTLSISSAATNDIFIVKYNTLGISQWATRIGGTGTDIAYSVYVDNSNNIIIGGNYATAAATFYSVGDISGLTLPVPSATTALLGKYDTNGTFLWGTRIGSSPSSSRNGYNVVTDSQNNIYIYVAGSTSTTTIRPFDISGINYTIDFSPGFSTGLYLIKYNPSGYAQNLISIQGQIANFYFGDTVFIKNDTIFLTGYSPFSAQVLFKDVSNQLIDNLRLDNSGNTDAFIAKVQLPTTTIYNESYNSGFNDGLIDGSNNNTAQYTANYPLITDYYKQNIYNNSYNYAKSLIVLATRNGNNDSYYRGRYGSATPPFYNNNSILQRIYNIAYTQRYNYYSTVQGDMKVNWATQIGGTGTETGYGITVDNSGYIYNVGTYNSNPNLFYNADRTLSNITLDLSGLVNSYVAKYDSSGMLVWAAKIQRSGADTRTYDIATDSENNLYLYGTYETASINFYNSDNTYSNIFLDNGGNRDIFLAKYNSNGFVQWALRLSGTSADEGISVKVDKDNNVYIAGRSNSTNLFIYDPLKNLQSTLNNISSNTMRFIVKFDKNGFFLWANKIIGNDITSYNTNYLSTDNSNNILLTGTTNNSAFLRLFDPSGTELPDLSLNVTNAGLYIYKFNSVGTPLWRSSIITRYSPYHRIMNTIDQYNNIYIVCPHVSPSSPNIMNSNNQNSGITINLSSNYPYLIVKYNPDGYALWATCITMNFSANFTAPSITYSGNYLYAGIPYASNSSLYNSDGNVSPYVFNTSGQTDSMLVKYDLSGTVKWASRFGGTGIDNIINITADKNSNIYMTGYYNSNPLNILNSDGVSALTLETTTQKAFIISYLNQSPIEPTPGESLDDYLSNITVTPENREEYKDVIIQSYSSTPVQEAPASLVEAFVTDTVPGYNINAVPKIMAIANSGETVSITSVKDSLTSGATELYLFVATGDPFTLQINGSTYNLTMLSNGISYNGTDYFLGDTILFDNSYKFTIKFLGSVGGPFELAQEPAPPAPPDTRPIRRGPMSSSDRLRQLQTRTIVADVARQRATGPRGSYDPTLVREAKLNYEVGAVNTTQTEFNNYKSG